MNLAIAEIEHLLCYKFRLLTEYAYKHPCIVFNLNCYDMGLKYRAFLTCKTDFN